MAGACRYFANATYGMPDQQTCLTRGIGSSIALFPYVYSAVGLNSFAYSKLACWCGQHVEMLCESLMVMLLAVCIREATLL